MKLRSLLQKVLRGLPYLGKEIRAQVSDHTPIFIGKPRVVHILRNAPCNARCIMCEFGYRKGADFRALFKSPLTDDIFPTLLHQIHELGGRGTMISYTAGEPLMCRPMFDWLEQARKLSLDLRFTTNGYLVDEEMARQLVAADMFNIGVSLESLDPAINEQIRPFPEGTAKTIRAIDLLLQEKQKHRSRLSINIKCTISQINIDAVVGILERWGKIDGVIVTPQMFEVQRDMPPAIKDKLWLTDLGKLEATMQRLKAMRNAGYNLNADDQALDSFVRLYRDDPQRQSSFVHKTVEDLNGHGCNIGTDNLFIVNGEVKLCPYYPALGNVLTDRATLKEMWYSEKAQKIRADIKRCRLLCTLSCLRRVPLSHKIKTFLKM